ncbi:MAG: phosphoribosylaminoimidazolesuccinocarboxamide synthase [Patescibacteria group bacterium]
MAVLSPARAAWPVLKGLKLVSRGKTRDVYDIGRGFLLIVVTDAISIFDIILNAMVPGKGTILNVMTVFWMRLLEAELETKTHLVAVGSQVDSLLPEPLRGDVELQSRAVVVRRVDMDPIEYIARGNLTGTGLEAYQTTRAVCGQRLPAGLQDGDELPFPLFTPTTKAEAGHDEHINAVTVTGGHPMAALSTLGIYGFARAYAASRGIVIADTKFEFGRDDDGRVVLADEVLTPDSSRYWAYSAWQVSQRQMVRTSPASFDKQLVRNWGSRVGVKGPLTAEHIARVHGIKVPQRILKATAQAYRYIFWRLTEQRVEGYLNDYMKVRVPSVKQRVAVLLGSRSDLESVRAALSQADAVNDFARLDVHVVSCHRNHDALRQFVASNCDGADTIIAAGGKAFALPGVVETLVHDAGREQRVIGVALGELGSEGLRAAELSITELPGQTVVIDEIAGRAYSGFKGMQAALHRVANGELPPPPDRKEAPAEFNISF